MPVMDEQDAPIRRRWWWRRIGETITSLFQSRAGYYSDGEINAEGSIRLFKLEDSFRQTAVLWVNSGRSHSYERIYFVRSFLPSSFPLLLPSFLFFFLPTRSALRRLRWMPMIPRCVQIFGSHSTYGRRGKRHSGEGPDEHTSERLL